ncbi:MAG: hypothetical protein LBQ66_16620 [Planctomycetaceae bacterium]|nr:hypothetical protein [Planctomycetaceae bacterium]
MVFRSNFFGAITHRGGRDARVPVPRRFAAVVGVADIGRFGFASAYSAPVVGLCRRNRPAVGYPPYICQTVLAFSSNMSGSIKHRGGRDARVPVRRRFAAVVGFADIGRFGFASACSAPVGGWLHVFTDFGKQMRIIARRLFVIACRLFVIACWLFVIACWLFVIVRLLIFIA